MAHPRQLSEAINEKGGMKEDAEKVSSHVALLFLCFNVYEKLKELFSFQALDQYNTQVVTFDSSNKA